MAESLSGAERLAAETPRQIANAHTIFNVSNALLFLPFAAQLARLVEWVVPDRPAPRVETGKEIFVTRYLDAELISTPVLAIEQARRESYRMAQVVRSMLIDIMTAFSNNDQKTADAISERDNHVDYLQQQTADYLIEINRRPLSSVEAERIVQLLYVINELEHIGDVIEKNLVSLVKKKAEGNIIFSKEGRAEALEYHRRVLESYDHAIKAFADGDAELAQSVTTAKPELVDLEHAYRRTHYDRLSRGIPESIASSQIHLDLMDYLRRINSYAEAIASTVLAREAVSGSVV